MSLGKNTPSLQYDSDKLCIVLSEVFIKIMLFIQKLKKSQYRIDCQKYSILKMSNITIKNSCVIYSFISNLHFLCYIKLSNLPAHEDKCFQKGIHIIRDIIFDSV